MSQIPQAQAQDPRQVASAVLQAVFQKDAAKALAEADVLSDEVWAYGCNGHPSHVGIIFFKEPQGGVPMHGGEWTSVVDRDENVVAFWGDRVHCQQCFMETGEMRVLRLRVKASGERHLGHTIMMEPSWKQRFAHKLSRADLQRFLPKAEEPKTPKPEKPNVRQQPQPAA